MIRARVRLCVALLWCGAVSAAPETGIETTYADHSRGVELARSGHYDEGLAILRPLAARFPDDYPLTRDIVLIDTWKGDCGAALDDFARIRANPRIDEYLVAPVADCAVQRARAGDYDAAIATLAALVPHASDAYPLRRDLAVITHWKGDCRGALRWFESIRNDPRNPPYLIAPMSSCLRREDRPVEATALVENALRRYPNDPLLAHERNMAEVALRLDAGLYDERREVDAELSSADSDRDLREWTLRAEASQPVAAAWRAYARYAFGRADDPAFAAGELNRIGAGVRWRIGPRLLLDQGVSGDVHQSGRGGWHTRLEYQPRDPWRLSVSRDTYAEDISVRARAAGIEAVRSVADVEYRDPDSRWYGYGSVNRYDFTDGNRRDALYATLGYGYARLPWREQRINVEWYRSRNSLDNAVYFNPRSDESIGLAHATAFVFDTRYKRHVDTLSISAGTYRQEGFGRRGTFGATYEQDYDFDDDRNLTIGFGVRRNYFDGERENDWYVSLRYRRKF